MGSLDNGAFSLGRTHSQHPCSSLKYSPQQDLFSGVLGYAARVFSQLLVFIKITYSGTFPGKRALKTTARFSVHARIVEEFYFKPQEPDSIKWPDSIEYQPSAGKSPPSSVSTQLELRLAPPYFHFPPRTKGGALGDNFIASECFSVSTDGNPP